MVGMQQLLGGIGQGASNMFGAGSSLIGSGADYIGNTKRMNRQQDAMGRSSEDIQALMDDIVSGYDPYTQRGETASQAMMDEYNQMKSAPPQGEYTPDMVDKWLDPSLDFQADMAQRALGAQQGASGDYLSSGAMQQMMEQNRKIGETGWGDARNFGYKEYRDKIAQDRTDLGNRLNVLRNMSNQGFNALGNQSNIKSGLGQQKIGMDLSKGMLGAEQSAMKSGLIGDVGQTMMNLGSADSAAFSNMMGGAGNSTAPMITQGVGDQGGQFNQGLYNQMNNSSLPAGTDLGNVGQTSQYNQSMFGSVPQQGFAPLSMGAGIGGLG